MAKTAFVALFLGFRVRNSVSVVIPNFKSGVNVSDAIFVAKRPNVKERNVRGKINQEVAFLQPQGVEQVREVLLRHFIVNIFESLLLVGKIELVESDEVGIWIFAQKNLGEAFSDCTISNKADFSGDLNLTSKEGCLSISQEVELSLE